MWPPHGRPHLAHRGPGPAGPRLSATEPQAGSAGPGRKRPAVLSPQPRYCLHRGWSRAPSVSGAQGGRRRQSLRWFSHCPGGPVEGHCQVLSAGHPCDQRRDLCFLHSAHMWVPRNRDSHIQKADTLCRWLNWEAPMPPPPVALWRGHGAHPGAHANSLFFVSKALALLPCWTISRGTREASVATQASSPSTCLSGPGWLVGPPGGMEVLLTGLPDGD